MKEDLKLNELENIDEIKEEELTDELLVDTFSGEVLDIVSSYLLSIKQYPLLSHEKTINLFKRMRIEDKDKIKNILIESNLRLVIYAVKKYYRVTSSDEFMELIQEGNIGLMKAIDKFDENLGYKFATYALYWIKQTITRSQDNNQVVRIPVHLKDMLRKYFKFESEYQKKYGYLPTKEEIKRYLNITEEKYNKLMYIQTNVNNVAYLNKLVSSEETDSSELIDFVVDEKDDYNNSLNKLNDLALMSVLKSSLSKVQYYILYHNVLSDKHKTLDEIGRILGVTRERVRQIKTKVKEKAKICLKKSRPINSNITKKDCLPENFEKIVILYYLKQKLFFADYYIFYHIWYKKQNIENFFYSKTINEIKFRYEAILKEYNDLLNYGDYYNIVIKELSSHYITKEIFNLDIIPLEYSNTYLLLETKSQDEIINILGPNYEELTNSKLFTDFFDTDFITIPPSYIERIFKTLNIKYYGYENKKINLPMVKLYETYLENKKEFTEDKREILEQIYFKNITKLKYEKERSKNTNNIINYSVYRLETMYYNIDNYFKYEIDNDILLSIITNINNRFSEFDIELLKKRYIEGISINDLANEYNKTYLKMHDDLRMLYDRAINLYLGITNKIQINNEERYKEYILNDKYKMADNVRKICYLYFIEYKSYKEIKDILNMKNTTKVSNILTEAIRKMEFWYYGILKPNFSVYSKEEIENLLKDSCLPISDYEKELLRLIKGIDGDCCSLKDLVKKYGYIKSSIERRINRALLSIKKYENGELEPKIDYETIVVPLLKYFSLFEQDILNKRYRDNMTCEAIAKIYHISKNECFPLIEKIEIRLIYLIKKEDAKKFDFDYAREVIEYDDLPFYGNKEKAIKIYLRFFGDDGKFPNTANEIKKELNLSDSSNTSGFIKTLMLAVLKYKEGYRKNKSFTETEIREFYNQNKDNYSSFYQKQFDNVLEKYQNDIMLSFTNIQNDFVTYEMLKDKKGELFYSKDTDKDSIKKIIINNSYKLTHLQLEMLRNYFKISKRELMNGKDKIKLIKLLYKPIIEYSLLNEDKQLIRIKK